ncbi:sensor histidine kinase [Frateuria soli]|uniref:sensor histidine kinase n=1 Tax=Frateuria soli TaxID=1542730 RepID=UPI001E2D636C|nr:HAMP domain-containing sensor histidine kinase [Frateuria soli]UGB38913.1 HAMP domain-containing histidine kinase [Frateuria soli]
MKPPSLAARITLLLVGTSLALLGGGALLMDWRIDHAMESRYRENLLTQAQALTTVVEIEQAVGEPQGPAGLLGGSDGAWYELRCEGMPTQRSTPPPPALAAGWPESAGATPRFVNVHRGARRLGAVMFAFQEPSATHPPTRHCALLFMQDRSAFDRLLTTLDWILVLSPALALLVALVAVPLIVRRGLKPVRALVERMRDIGPHAPGQRLPASGTRELDPLVARFNDVLARMDDGLARERQFASGLAHETRTRLAELRALAEVEARYPSGRELGQILGEIGQIGAELEATVAALLLLTRLQSGLEHPQRQPLELASWLERQLQRHRARAAARGLVLKVEGTPPAHLHTDPALLEVVLGNLLGNACAYAPEGDTVEVDLDRDSLRISNAAPGLEPADLARFGQRFWRKQPPHAGHAGLGLALAHAAAEALGMDLRFELRAGRLHARLALRAP